MSTRFGPGVVVGLTAQGTTAVRLNWGVAYLTDDAFTRASTRTHDDAHIAVLKAAVDTALQQVHTHHAHIQRERERHRLSSPCACLQLAAATAAAVCAVARADETDALVEEATATARAAEATLAAADGAEADATAAQFALMGQVRSLTAALEAKDMKLANVEAGGSIDAEGGSECDGVLTVEQVQAALEQQWDDVVATVRAAA